MTELREIVDQLKRDAEFWKLKFDASFRNAKDMQEQRDEYQTANEILMTDLRSQAHNAQVLLDEKQEQINAVHARCEDLMQQNDRLSDRIHLDLDPRIVAKDRAIEQLGEKNREALVEIAALSDANDGLEDTISELRGAIKAYVAEYEKTERNRRRVTIASNMLGRYER
jgi:chromosome segregation ATPase